MKATVENLRTYAVEPLTRWLIAAAKERYTVTYGEAKERLERELRFSTIFSTRMGEPAGRLMDRLLDCDEDAPLLNVLLVRQDDGLPGQGAGWYLANRFDVPWLAAKDSRKRNPEGWREYAERAAEEAYNYRGWEDLYKKVYGRAYPFEAERALIRAGTERDDLFPGGRGEGKNHRALRLWVEANAPKVAPRLSLVDKDTEVSLLSADKVDVIYYGAQYTLAIEVKSRDSNRIDLRRGIYQCVKYAAVLRAMDVRRDAPVKTLLVSEVALPGDLKELAKRLDVQHLIVPPSRRLRSHA